MSIKWKIVFSLLAVFIVGDIIFLLYPRQVKSSLLKKLSPSYYKEKLIGDDFIALSGDKILSLLSLPENKGKIIIPANLNENTKIKINSNAKSEKTLMISNFLDDTPEKRVIFYAGQVPVKPSAISGGVYTVYFDGDKEIFVWTRSPSTILLKEPKNKTMLRLGDPLVIGFSNEKNTNGEYAFHIWGVDNKEKRFLPPDDFLLKYKNRWVVLLTE